LEFVNVDLIAHGLAPYKPDSVAIEAAKIALRRIRELIKNRIGFTWETTMSGRTAVSWLRQAKEAGFVLKAYFLWVRHTETTIQRIRQRVVEGGRSNRKRYSNYENEN
jgi:predicted ABC-type ATPase